LNACCCHGLSLFQMSRVVFRCLNWSPDGEEFPLLGKRKAGAGADGPTWLVAAVLALLLFCLLLQIPWLPENVSAAFPMHDGALSEKTRRAHPQSAAEELSSATSHLDLAYCSVPQTPTRDWAAWLRNYTPPSCPSVRKSRVASASGFDKVHIGNQVEFEIQPVKSKAAIASSSAPSVAVVFLDAVSRASFFRSFPTASMLIKEKMAKVEAFTLGGLASSYRYTYPNAALALAGLSCSDTTLTGFSYENACKFLTSAAPGDVTLWEHARQAGMATSVSMEDWQDLKFLRRGIWDHEFHAKNVSGGIEEHPTEYGTISCLGGEELASAQLKHTEAVHKAYDESGHRVFSFTHIWSMHQRDTRQGQVVDAQLRRTITSLSRSRSPTAVLVFGDHGTQWAQSDDEQAERYLPLGVFLPQRGAAKDWAATLAENQFAVTSMADLHLTMLRRINPEAQPAFATWPYKAMFMWPLRAVDLASHAAGARSVSELGIQMRHHPCAMPWVQANSSKLDSRELLAAAAHVVSEINARGLAGRLGGPCRRVQLAAIAQNQIYTREPFQLKLTIDVETEPMSGRPQHTAKYYGSLHRSWGYCDGYMQSACLFGGWVPWFLDELEPLSTYSQYQGCMGEAAATSDQKRFCICDD